MREVARRRRHWAHVHEDGMNSISIKCIRCLSLLSKGLPAKKLETLDTDTISRRGPGVPSFMGRVLGYRLNDVLEALKSPCPRGNFAY